MLDVAWLAANFPDLRAVAPLGAPSGQKWVYAAEHAVDGAVVLKLIKPGQDLERVRREILAVQRVASPRVPKILEVGVLRTHLGDLVWFREQRISGHSVRAVLQARSVLASDEILTLAEQVAEALEAGERVRIVHRDVKPDNVMVDNRGSYWLLDFGIARHLDLVSATPTGLYGVFTPGYAPPEQFRNVKREIDARADLFALGITLYECATGKNPYRDGTRDPMEMLRRVESVVLPPITRPDVRPDVRDLVMTLAQRRADHRPATAAEALEWIRGLKAGASP